MPQGPPERPGWQVRISPVRFRAGPDGTFVEAGVPSGGGVWIGDRWVLTCAHVLGPEPRTVMVQFNFADGEPVPATVAPRGWLPEQQGDLALLELDRDPPPTARPAPLRPARAVTGHGCAAYGYPRGLDGGVFSEPDITGQTADRLQLTARAAHGHQIEKGFSGTGLFDTETGAVVGLVVTRDKGKDVLGGFAIPLQTVVAAFPQLGPWVGWRLGTDRFYRQHWRPRARGVYQDTTRGWYFTGRTALLRELTGWLERGLPDRAVRVVTGPAGTGKSAVLAWLCALSDPQLRAEIAAAAAQPTRRPFRQRAGSKPRYGPAAWTPDGAAGALTAALTLPVAAHAPVEDVLAAAGDLDPAERAGLVVVLDALDEARTPRDIARQLLVPLARDLGVKVLAGTRPGRDEELLAALGGRAVIYRLDDPAWFDRHDLADYAAACLRADFDPDLASGYRTDPGACRQVAAAIAEAAGSNFLVAGLAARTWADEPVIDVGAPGWRDRPRFPAEVGQAFDDYLARFGENERRARDLLRAVAYAEGTGLPADELWAGMATALAAPRRYGTDDLAWLLDSAAAYLVESGSEHGQPVYRIFHQALIEHLRPEGEEIQRQRELVEALIQVVPSGPAGPDWSQAPSYIRRYLAAHAAAAGLLDELLEDPVYLAAADPGRLLRVLPAASASPAKLLLERVGSRLAGRPDGERAAVLELGARQLGARRIADRLAQLPPGWRPWSVRWAHQQPVGHDRILGWHDGPVWAVAVGERNRRAVVVSGGSDGMVRVWDLRSGGLEAKWRHGKGRVKTVAIGQLAEGPVVVSGGEDGRLRRWHLADGSPYGEPLNLGKGKVTSAAIGDLAGQRFIVAGYEHVCTVGLWDLDTGQPLGELDWGSDFPLHERLYADVRAVAAGSCNGKPVIVAGHEDGAHRWVWTGSEWAAKPLISDESIWAVALGMLAGRPVAVFGGESLLTTLDLESGELAAPSYESPDYHVIGIAVGEVDGRAVAVSGNFFGTDRGILRVWDLAAEKQPLKGSLIGHYAGVQALAITQLDDQPVLVSGGFDRAIGVWDLKDSLDRMPDRVEYHYFEWLQACELGGRPTVVSKSSATVSFSKSWVWRKKVNKYYTDGPFLISRSSTFEREDTDTSAKPVIRVWDQADGTPVDAPSLDLDRLGDLRAVGRVGDAVLGVSMDDIDDLARPERFGEPKSTHLKVRDLRNGAQVGPPIPVTSDVGGLSHTLAVGGLGDRPVVAFCDALPGDDSLLKERWLQVWDVHAGRLVWEPLPAYQDRGGPVVRAVGTLDEQPIAVVTALNRFGIWDLQRGELIAEPPSIQGEADWMFAPAAIGELAGRPVVVYSGYGLPIRIWDMKSDRECTRAIVVDTEIRAITIAPDSTIVAAGPAGGLALRVEATFFEPMPAPRERRTKAVDAEARVFSVAGPADRAYLASVSLQEPLEKDGERYAELRRKLGLIDEDEQHSGYDRFGRLVLYGTRAAGFFDWSTRTIRYDGTTETLFAVGWPFLRMEYRPLWSGRDADLDDAAVFRGEASRGGRAVYIFLPDGRIDLLPAEDLDELYGGFNWGYHGEELEISICRAAGLLRGGRRSTWSTYPAFRRWLKDLVENQHDADGPLEIPVGLVRAKFQQLKETRANRPRIGLLVASSARPTISGLGNPETVPHLLAWSCGTSFDLCAVQESSAGQRRASESQEARS